MSEEKKGEEQVVVLGHKIARGGNFQPHPAQGHEGAFFFFSTTY